MNEGKDKKEKSFEEKIIDLHKPFLDAVKDVYPLAVLGSLCIAITAFTQQTYPQVQPYSIAAACLFLIAFMCSFIFKIDRSHTWVIFSFISTALAVFMLFLVVWEFYKAILLVNMTIGLIVGLGFLVYFEPLFFMHSIPLVKTKSKAPRLCGIIGISSASLLAIVLMLSISSTFLGSELVSSQMLTVLFASSLCVYMISLIITPFISKERTKKISEQKQAKQ